MCCTQEPFKNTVKGVVFGFNFLFWLAGCALILAGVWAFYEKSRFGVIKVTSAYDILFDAAIVLMVFGGIIFFVTFSGCIGAIRENVCLLKTYIIILVVMLVLELAGGLVVFIFRDKVKDAVTETLIDEGIIRYRDDEDFQNIFDWTQVTFKCCGVGYKSYLDWSKNIYFNCTDANPSSERCSVPYSCCTLPDNLEVGLYNRFCGYGVQRLSKFKAADKVFVQGCVDALITAARTNFNIVGSLVIGVAGLQALAAMTGVLLVNEIPKTF